MTLLLWKRYAYTSFQFIHMYLYEPSLYFSSSILLIEWWCVGCSYHCIAVGVPSGPVEGWLTRAGDAKGSGRGRGDLAPAYMGYTAQLSETLPALCCRLLLQWRNYSHTVLPPDYIQSEHAT